MAGKVYQYQQWAQPLLTFVPTVLYMRLGEAASTRLVLPSGYLGTWSYTNPSNAGASANALDLVAGSSQLSAAVSGVSAIASPAAAAQFCSPPLCAQTISAGWWTIGYAFMSSISSLCRWDMQIFLVNGATGAVRTNITAALSGSLGATTTEATAFSVTISGAAFTALAGDYIAIEAGAIYSSPPSSSTFTIFADGTTGITADRQATTDAQSFISCPQTLLWLPPPPLVTNWYRETEHPIWDRPRLQYLAPTLTEPVSPTWIETTQLDKWYPQAPTPRWDAPRLQYLNPTFAGPVSNIFPAAVPTVLYMRLGEAAPGGIPLPSGYLGGWVATGNLSFAGANARALDTVAGSGQLSSTVSGVVNTNPVPLGQFCSPRLAAQSIGVVNWTFGCGMLSSFGITCRAQVSILLINGATGAIRTTIASAALIGNSDLITTEKTAFYAVVSGAAFTAIYGDYIIIEAAVAYTSTPSSSSLTLFADGTTAVTSDRVSTTDAQSFISCPQKLLFAPPAQLDQWYRATELPRWDVVRNQYLYPSVLQEPVKSEPPPVVTNWFVNTAVPKWDIPRLQHLDPTFVGPVSNVFPETPQVDKWFKNTEHTVWDRPRLQYLHPTFTGPVSTTYIEASAPDKWLPVFPDKVWDAPRLQHLDPTIQAGPTMYIERITSDKWAPVFPDKIWDRPRLQHLDPTFVGPVSNYYPEAPVLSKWFKETERPRWDRPRNQFLYPAASPEPTYPQAPIRAANWFVNTATPKWDMARQQHLWPTLTDPISNVFPERATPDKWFKNTETPRWDRPRLQHLNPTFFGPVSNTFPERATPDKWLGTYPDKIWDRPRLQHLNPTRQDGPVSSVFRETLTPDEWAFNAPYMPVAARLQHLFPTAVENPRTIAKTIGTLLDAWYKETARPNWDRPRQQAPWPTMVNPVSPGWEENLPLHKWYVNNPDMVPAAKRLQYLYPVVSAGPLSTKYKEAAQLDKWFKETERPLWDKARQQALWPTLVGPTTLAFTERTKVDKWYSTPNLPQRALPATGYLNQAAPSMFAPTFFKWQQLVEPSSQVPLPAWAKGKGYSLAAMVPGYAAFLLVNFPTVVFTASDILALKDLVKPVSQFFIQDALFLTDTVSSQALQTLLESLTLQDLPALIVVMGSGVSPIAFLVATGNPMALLGVEDTPLALLVAAEYPKAWLQLAN